MPNCCTPRVLKPWETGGILSTGGMSTARFSVEPEREPGTVEEEPMLDWMEQASTTVPTPALFTEEAGGGKLRSPRMSGREVMFSGTVVEGKEVEAGG